MRGVEGAGAYRIGHPLGVDNDSASIRFQSFLRNMATRLRSAKSLTKQGNIPRKHGRGAAWRKIFCSPQQIFGRTRGSGRRRAAPERAGKRADEQQNEENEQKQLC